MLLVKKTLLIWQMFHKNNTKPSNRSHLQNVCFSNLISRYV